MSGDTERRLVWVTPTRVRRLPADDAPTLVGEKASGLLWLPQAWVPPFFVLSPAFHQLFSETSVRDRNSLIDSWTGVFQQGLAAAGLDKSEQLYLRSNAVGETIESRGRYRSEVTLRRDWKSSLRRMLEQPGYGKQFGLVVQQYVQPLIRGFLSNARRVAREYRDAKVEFIDPASGVTAEESLSYRRWRRPRGASTGALVCHTAKELGTVLREPLAYAAGRKSRMQFEWLWDGTVVYVVQADRALEKAGGVSPESLVKAIRTPVTQSEGLLLFREAKTADVTKSRKLRNHYLYAAHGFKQPPFYVLDTPATITRILEGDISADLVADLQTLTHRPLVLRTSSSESVTLLPRSDELRNADQAVKWLMETFAADIRGREKRPAHLALVAHHFIPALAAAFATASPEEREVYIEALWGIPEGLYYYPCDAYLVDTIATDISELPKRTDSFRIREDVRCKETFVAPNRKGQFVVSATKPPWDWKPVLSDRTGIGEIARFTRELAAIEKRPVKVMWFLDCAKWTGLPRMLPWYHDFEADNWRQPLESYQRNSRDERLSLRTFGDLSMIEEKAASGYRSSGVRNLVISIDPVENSIVRNEEIAERVGKAAVALGAVVELRGGVLSHLYYVLKRENANIAVKNPPSFVVQPQSFQKLVRDRIPEVVASAGEEARIARLSPQELTAALKGKLVEEAFETRDASSTELANEIADVLDVIDALVRVARISASQLKTIRRKKHERRGGFEEGIVLLETSLPLGRSAAAQVPSILPSQPSGRVVETSHGIDLQSTKTGPFDVREGDDFVELVQSATVALTHPQWTLSSPAKIRVNPSALAESIEWTIEGKREGSQMKLRVKIRLGSEQLILPL